MTLKRGPVLYNEGFVLIPLGHGKYASVDLIDADRVLAHRWYAVRPNPKSDIEYAQTTVYVDGKKRSVYMHHTVLMPVPGKRVDHRDGNGLNNRRNNLRHSSQQQNQHNRNARRDGSSRFKGVYFHKAAGKWAASIKTPDGLRKHLGLFGDEVEAARVYDLAAAEYFGAYARLNFP